MLANHLGRACEKRLTPIYIKNNLIRSMNDIIISIIANVLQVPTKDVTVDTEIGELDEWDSLRNVTIFAELQKQFDIKITQDMLVDLENVADIIDLVEDLTK